MFSVCLKSLELLAKAIKGTEYQATIDRESAADHEKAIADLRSSYFDAYRVAKSLILKPQMRE